MSETDTHRQDLERTKTQLVAVKIKKNENNNILNMIFFVGKHLIRTSQNVLMDLYMCIPGGLLNICIGNLYSIKKDHIEKLIV